jgi:hypothetical protein
VAHPTCQSSSPLPPVQSEPLTRCVCGCACVLYLCLHRPTATHAGGAVNVRPTLQHKSTIFVASDSFTPTGHTLVPCAPFLICTPVCTCAHVQMQVNASLIVVYTHTGQTAELVAKYRPPMPILTLVVPHLTSNKLKWKLEGRCVLCTWMCARGCAHVCAWVCICGCVHMFICVSVCVVICLLSGVNWNAKA